MHRTNMQFSKRVRGACMYFAHTYHHVRCEIHIRDAYSSFIFEIHIRDSYSRFIFEIHIRDAYIHIHANMNSYVGARYAYIHSHKHTIMFGKVQHRQNAPYVCVVY